MYSQKKHMILNLSFILLIVMTVPAQGSEAPLGTLLQTVDKVFLAPNNKNLKDLMDAHPEEAAILMGMVLRTQINYVNLNPSLKPALDALVRDSEQYAGMMAKPSFVLSEAANRKKKEAAKAAFNLALSSHQYDNAISENYNVDPAKLNIPLFLEGASLPMADTEVPAPADNTQTPAVPDEAQGKFIEKDPNSISLLGIKPDKSGAVKEGIDPDIILGQWSDSKCTYKGSYHPMWLTVTKENGRYIATGGWGNAKRGGNIGFVMRYDTGLFSRGEMQVYYIVEQALDDDGEWKAMNLLKATYDEHDSFCDGNGPEFVTYSHNSSAPLKFHLSFCR